MPRPLWRLHSKSLYLPTWGQKDWSDPWTAIFRRAWHPLGLFVQICLRQKKYNALMYVFIMCHQENKVQIYFPSKCQALMFLQILCLDADASSESQFLSCLYKRDGRVYRAEELEVCGVDLPPLSLQFQGGWLFHLFSARDCLHFLFVLLIYGWVMGAEHRPSVVHAPANYSSNNCRIAGQSNSIPSSMEDHWDSSPWKKNICFHCGWT